jgi:hypothetical protein
MMQLRWCALLRCLACCCALHAVGAHARTLAAAGVAGAPAPRVLACFWGLDRATDVTFASFQKFVLNVFNADLCAAVTDRHRDGSGAWRAAAKYLDVYEEPQSYEPFISSRARLLARNSSLEHVLRDNFLHPTGIQQMYSKARIWRLIEQHRLLDEYDWFLLCRTDLMWLAPHADFRGDETRSVWVPYAGRKSDWQGYYDRAVVVHKSRTPAAWGSPPTASPSTASTSSLQTCRSSALAPPPL